MHTQATLPPFAPSGHVTTHLHPITSHLHLSVSLFLSLSLSLSHSVGICVLSQSWEEKLGMRGREKGRCWTNKRKKRGERVFCTKSKSRLSSSHSLSLSTLTTLDASCRCSNERRGLWWVWHAVEACQYTLIPEQHLPH